MSDTKESQGPPIPQAEPLQLLLSGDPGEALPGGCSRKGFCTEIGRSEEDFGKTERFSVHL